MTYEEYLEESKEVQVSVAAALLVVLRPYLIVTEALSPIEWLRLLAAMYPIIWQGHSDSGRIARSFYDSERSKHRPEEELPEVWLANLDPDAFEDAMTQYRNTFTRNEWPEGFNLKMKKEETAANMVADSMRIVDNGGRETLAVAALDDPYAGWARVEGGDKSCEFCVMLISRGPVYSSEEAKKDSYAYHRFCDCRMVVVYDEDDWPGREQYLAAEELYRQAAKAEGDTLKNLKDLING